MTDNEIKEMLEDCGCPECTAILDLIKRQQEENERLNKTKDEWELSAINKARRVDELTNEIAKLKFSSIIGATRAEAIKEFADRLREYIVEDKNNPLLNRYLILTNACLDRIVKEMTEGEG